MSQSSRNPCLLLESTKFPTRSIDEAKSEPEYPDGKEIAHFVGECLSVIGCAVNDIFNDSSAWFVLIKREEHEFIVQIYLMRCTNDKDFYWVFQINELGFFKRLLSLAPSEKLIQLRNEVFGLLKSCKDIEVVKWVTDSDMKALFDGEKKLRQVKEMLL